MKIYHYARIDDWKDMKRKDEIKGVPTHLRAGRRLGIDHMEAWKTTGVFGVLEPTPDNWVNNKEFNLTWDALKHDIGGRMLLEIKVDSGNDQDVFIVDRGHAEGFLYRNVEDANISEKYAHKKKAEAEKAYLDSKIPIQEYMQRSEELNYSLPEVIITKNIPMERLSVSAVQPFLEEVLKEGDCKYKRDFIERMRDVPELNEWYKKKVANDVPETKEARRYFEGGLK